LDESHFAIQPFQLASKPSLFHNSIFNRAVDYLLYNTIEDTVEVVENSDKECFSKFIEETGQRISLLKWFRPLCWLLMVSVCFLASSIDDGTIALLVP
jgi:hypothetical protein